MDIVEGHPIPQDITGFQFRIIGDLTIRQFVYLAIGLLLGWIMISVSLPVIIKVPIAILVSGTGAFFAFVPIQGRPADTMLLLFIRAVLKANEYTYEKQSPMATIGSATPAVPMQAPPAMHAPEEPAAPVSPQPPIAAVPTAPTEHAEEHHANAGVAHEKTLELEDKLSSVLEEKQQLEKQLLQLQQQLQQKPQQIFTPTAGSLEQTDHVKTIPDELKKASGAPLAPDTPNLILGVVKDPRGKVLPNILIEVKDTEGNPVRAFKTNRLGQFASATPLANGTYIVTFEDGKKEQQFDTIEVVANGTIISPLEVISVDEREHLRKSLFGG